VDVRERLSAYGGRSENERSSFGHAYAAAMVTRPPLVGSSNS
jgi:hypothetical protein